MKTEREWESWDNELLKIRVDLYGGVVSVDLLIHSIPPSEEKKEKLRQQMKVLHHDIAVFGKLVMEEDS